MRVVIDMQGAQASNATRGIGRYSLALSKEMVRLRGEHEVILALNGLFRESIEPIRATFADLLPAENIYVWDSVAPVNAADLNNDARRQVAEIAREAFLANLRPDIILTTSLFEGLGDDAITSIGNFTSRIPTAVILYDLIPLIHSDIYLQNSIFERWYLNKIDQLRRADLLLAISNSSGMEAIDYLGFPSSSVVNISTACDDHFQPIFVDNSKYAFIQKKYGLIRPFIMYTGGIDYRKNIEGLIKAYSSLPSYIRETHQLAVVCSIHKSDRERLQQLAKTEGLAEKELIFTGFVTDEDLVTLYNICKLFIFPSWHEGFGLPALEAMACGRAVIGANTSSVPEVIENKHALFDPFDHKDIASKILVALTDDDFRFMLEQHGLVQAKKFSWASSASRAWKAVEDFLKTRNSICQEVRAPQHRPRLAYFSPLPPAQSGISDYSSELLPELARHYQIYLIVKQGEVSDPWIQANCSIHDVSWFRQHAESFDRVMYHFGNSDFHSHMFDLLGEFPGVIVLHDFFLSGIVAHMDVHEGKTGSWSQALLHAHGWPALRARYKATDTAEVVYAYPSNLDVLQKAVGVIVHSEYSRRLACEWYGDDVATDWSVIPLLRVPVVNKDREDARKTLGLNNEDFVVCSFGLLGPTKLNHRLLSSWLASPMANDPHCRLVFVGQNHSGEYGAELVRLIRSCNVVSRIEITGWADTKLYRNWLAAADVGVQLRTLSRGETSAAALDCLNYGLATIVNANGAMENLPHHAVWMLPDEFSDEDLTIALTTLWQNIECRTSLGKNAREVILAQHQPRYCAELYTQAIEHYYQESLVGLPVLCSYLTKREFELGIEDKKRLATVLSNNFPPQPRRKQMLLDISELVQRDAKSGIQRVVRALLQQLLLNPPEGWTIEPIYATSDIPGYRYARRFISRFLNVHEGWSEDEIVETWPGDIFLGLDLQPVVVPAQTAYLQSLHRRGIKVFFIVYDLLPVLLPHAFLGNEETQAVFQHWLKCISAFDGAICISRAVADELNEWLRVFGEERSRPFTLGWFHLGADVGSSIPTRGIPTDADSVINAMATRPSFLMVGTLEPRKRHEQTLAAFELLWNQGCDINLVIVGKRGWMVDTLVEKLRSHEEVGKKLFWLDGISDEYLEKIYAISTCLIVASEGEGFGLPLIEAAQHKIPIIARDIPIFREVVGEHGFYFSEFTPKALADCVREWLILYKADQFPRSDKMPWLTWNESALNLLDVMLGDHWYQQWMPDDVHRFWGGDNRLGSQVGKRNGREIITTDAAGYLLFGPYISLAANQYQIKIQGLVGSGGLSGARMDVAIDKGTIILAESILSEPDLNGCLAIVPISLDQSCTDLEVRVWVSYQSDLKVSMIEIAPWQDEPVISQAVSKNAEQKVAQVSVSTSSVIKNTSRLASTSGSRNQAKSKRKKRR